MKLKDIIIVNRQCDWRWPFSLEIRPITELSYSIAIHPCVEAMPTHHVMLSYQWNVQALVEKVYQGLRHLGINGWMDTHGGITGNINDRWGEIEIICMPLTNTFVHFHHHYRQLHRHHPVINVTIIIINIITATIFIINIIILSSSSSTPSSLSSSSSSSLPWSSSSPLLHHYHHHHLYYHQHHHHHYHLVSLQVTSPVNITMFGWMCNRTAVQLGMWSQTNRKKCVQT